MRFNVEYIVVTLAMLEAFQINAPVQAKSFGSERVARLACADPNETVDTRNGSELYCYEFVNTCGSPVSLTIKDNVTHTLINSGQVKDRESGKACAGHNSKIDHYIIFRSNNTQSSGASDNSWIGTAVRYWVCSAGSQSVIREDNNFEIWNGSNFVTLRLNGLEKDFSFSKSDYTVKERYSVEESGNRLTIKGRSSQGDYNGPYSWSDTVAVITRTGTKCACTYLSNRHNKYDASVQRFRESSVYTCR